jgi:hypothetical protein
LLWMVKKKKGNDDDDDDDDRWWWESPWPSKFHSFIHPWWGKPISIDGKHPRKVCHPLGLETSKERLFVGRMKRNEGRKEGRKEMMKVLGQLSFIHSLLFIHDEESPCS